MTATTVSQPVTDPLRQISAHCQEFKGANSRQAARELIITAILFALSMGGMLVSHFLQQWVLLALLAIPASGLLVRLFTIQHDCGHGSYFRSRMANDSVGRILSLLTLTPYNAWKRAHNMHHAASGNLHHRGAGGIDTVTVREYQSWPWRKRLAYRFYRHPFVMVLLGTPVYVIIMQRIPFITMTPFYESYRAIPAGKVAPSIILLDAAIVAFYGAIGFMFGWPVLLTVFLPVLALTSAIGGWLFFVQHQFEDTYWQPAENWDFRSAALGGSSYYVLPRVLQWFTGNIGLHHIHHLCSAIPNYRLQECLEKNEALQQINRMTLRDSLKCLRCALWDEELQKMVGFSSLSKAAISA